MPQDPNLYGQRPAKRQKKEIALSSSLAFTSQLASLLSTPSTSTASATAGRARPSKIKDDLFSVKAKRKAPKSNDGGAKLTLRETNGTEEEKQDFSRGKRKMEEKARLYAAMKRGDYIAKEGETAPLVDFDKKWVESHPDDTNQHSSSGTDDSEDEGSTEIIEFKDEFGRTRRGTRADLARQERMAQRRALGAEELERLSARPKAPEKLIYGDEIQTHAFNPEDETWDKMEQLAAKRDRTPTPPPDLHYDGNHEIRTKGVGFYHFSKEKEARDAEMVALDKERDNTERIRREREMEKERRRKEIEERRRKIGEKRAEKMADNFLEGLAGELVSSSVRKEPSEEA
ncbi:uncharacterized protein BCR38DRAFT_439584 [Pseudomassariella vexata]|uniref:Uncharacterized protein n=1 Tax=Pseudomassariella vexata TaxID=1141098 RepID=A0A1Y2DPN2_9PEZI|nr:uncharacterized protein BCR38DRAFT_439584 [Pseudomassariella vexata]ORY61210.1 hypothetical protein BCR38DRAFT_439584 [Pseudomassariella vexata]